MHMRTLGVCNFLEVSNMNNLGFAPLAETCLLGLQYEHVNNCQAMEMESLERLGTYRASMQRVTGVRL